MEQEIHEARNVLAVEQTAIELLQLRPDARQRRDRSEKRVEQARPHTGSGMDRSRCWRERASEATVTHAFPVPQSSRRLTFRLRIAICHAPGSSGLLAFDNGPRKMTTHSSDGLDVRRRKILFRAWHRG